MLSLGSILCISGCSTLLRLQRNTLVMWACITAVSHFRTIGYVWVRDLPFSCEKNHFSFVILPSICSILFFEQLSFMVRYVLLLQPSMLQKKDVDHKGAHRELIPGRAQWKSSLKLPAKHIHGPTAQNTAKYYVLLQAKETKVAASLTPGRCPAGAASTEAPLLPVLWLAAHPQHFQMLTSFYILQINTKGLHPEYDTGFAEEKQSFFNPVHVKVATLSEGISSPIHEILRLTFTWIQWLEQVRPYPWVKAVTLLSLGNSVKFLFANKNEALANLNRTLGLTWLHHSPSCCMSSDSQIRFHCAAAEIEESMYRRWCLSQRTASHRLLSFPKADFVKVISQNRSSNIQSLFLFSSKSVNEHLLTSVGSSPSHHSTHTLTVCMWFSSCSYPWR